MFPSANLPKCGRAEPPTQVVRG